MKEKDKESKARNFVKKYAYDFCKPSRFRDKKNDYDRRSRHERHWYEDAKESDDSSESQRTVRFRENKNRGSYSKEKQTNLYWSELEEDSPDSEEV